MTVSWWEVPCWCAMTCSFCGSRPTSTTGSVAGARTSPGMAPAQRRSRLGPWSAEEVPAHGSRHGKRRGDHADLVHVHDLAPSIGFGLVPVSYTHLTLPTNRE